MSARQKKAIVTCAVTGSIHTPSMSPYLPISASDIGNAAVDAAQAGASIVHLHARHPHNGQPSQDPKLFMEFLPSIRKRSNVVINLTTGGAPNMPVEERQYIACLRPGVSCSRRATPMIRVHAAARLVALSTASSLIAETRAASRS
ncbi:uncharacterized protein (DUF849 family) [Paraburkholderia sp. GAS41]|jgi:uncharacterized protein (DUF849 family)